MYYFDSNYTKLQQNKTTTKREFGFPRSSKDNIMQLFFFYFSASVQSEISKQQTKRAKQFLLVLCYSSLIYLHGIVYTITVINLKATLICIHFRKFFFIFLFIQKMEKNCHFHSYQKLNHLDDKCNSNNKNKATNLQAIATNK